MNVLVFKTDMVCERCKQTVANYLNQFDTTLRWSVDLEDCDKVLRVETDRLSANEIISFINEAGYRCEELV